MPLRYQHGYLRCVKRKTGPSQWEFLWRENLRGRRIRRTTVIGSIDEYPTEELALQFGVNQRYPFPVIIPQGIVDFAFRAPENFKRAVVMVDWKKHIADRTKRMLASVLQV